MKRFAGLYESLDRTTSTNAKVGALAAYFSSAPPADAAWALYFLTGRKIKRLVSTRVLWELTLEMTGLPEWLLEYCYAAVGDFAEMMALLVGGGDGASGQELGLERWVQERILSLKHLGPDRQRAALRSYWTGLDAGEILVLNKIITGEFRVGVSTTLVVRALAQAAGIPPATMAHRVMGEWQPSAEFFRGLLRGDGRPQGEIASRPYPFFLASPLEGSPEALGPRADWLAEWKWDGIRAQLIRRAGSVFLWSRGEEAIAGRFPELVAAASRLPEGTVLDGEILAYGDSVLPFSVLQTRIGRKKLTAKVLTEAPVAFLAYDVLEQDGVDVRERPLRERRERLEGLPAGGPALLKVSPSVTGESWSDLARLRQEARARHVEGLMLKRLSSPYGAGRKRGDWWKWKIEPFTIDAVLIYAHPGHGKRASLFTDYTFAVWSGPELLPVAKAYSGLSDEEIAELDAWIRRNTRERFGPVRAVEPVQVFEIAFQAIAPSSRHKSGVAVRFPRILRWRRDKPASEADTLESLRALLRARP